MRWEVEPSTSWTIDQIEGWVLYFPDREPGIHSWINLWSRSAEGDEPEGTKYFVHTPRVSGSQQNHWNREMTKEEWDRWLQQPEEIMMEFLL